MIIRSTIAALLLVALAAEPARGLQVFVTNLTVFTKHRLNFEGDLRVYFQCQGNDRVNLPDVTIEGHPYSWPKENQLLTTITRSTCKQCGFYEDRLIPFVKDDPIGAEFPLCESDFNSEDSEDNMVRWFADTQFDAVLFCGDCKIPSPPPPPAAAFDPNGGVTNFAAVDPAAAGAASSGGGHWWAATGAIVGMSVSGAVLVGFMTGLVAYSWYKQRQSRKKEERARAFEAVFSDPELDLEEVAAQDAKAAGFNLFGGNKWTRLRDTQEYAEAVEQERRRQGMPLPYPGLRLEEYNYSAAKGPHYPEAYLESKHTLPFAHWRTPKGVAEWTGFLAAQALNAAAAMLAHGPAWLFRIPRDTVWFRRVLLLECLSPVPGTVASIVAHVRALATLRGPGSFVESYQRESGNAHAHLLTLLQLRPSLSLRALVLLSQAAFALPYAAAYAVAPRACHAFVCHLSGLTGEAISGALRDLDSGSIPSWQRLPAPESAAAYWGLPEGATMRTVLLVVRADMVARSAINQDADPATFQPGCQLASLEDILAEEYALDYNLPQGPVILRSRSNASSLSDTGSFHSGSRKDLASPAATPAHRRLHSAARAAFHDLTPAKFGRAKSGRASRADPNPALTSISLTEEKYAQLQAVEEDKSSKPAAEKGLAEKFSMEGKQADLAAIMDSMWGSSRF
ncbi:hypothetical protein COCSUDRAFT_48069 [Coccomyxa subellipsoidea C-169]|uniref:Ubiquinol oxidase n=1 Tax=Coccomyxa subellipsoidea (strain C-169) TaxID=574566 RepID=I0YSF8_COCSC|nr:hypothetical protein COCSUDRAFT_48069 [Coccomyxa subellipsoidea C-169]EIE21327.1 hypothetical protein COCSUDRAFT_48069 [Coccomyxa subellipsoidea C-169]|eukprot:XP_005645871.1 hypothetical protein COCSUDRAFT_48069 [Coccomyxa subellipsoidea C-169]